MESGFGFRPTGESGASELYLEDVPLREVAERFGTPCYIYGRKLIESNFLAYQSALAEMPHLVCFAVKSNSSLAVLNLLARLGAGFDIVSGGELERVIRAGGDPSRVVFSGVGKQAWEIEAALRAGIHCFNAESEAELQLIQGIASGQDVVAPVSLRVNPDVDARTHPYISTGLKENKFGIPFEEAVSLYEYAQGASHLKVTGIDCHIGSQLTDIDPFLDALDKLLMLVDQLSQRSIELEHLDIGGGLGVTYHDEQIPAITTFIEAVRKRLKGRSLSLLLEPGRSIVANAGVFLTRVELTKKNGDKHFAVVDGAMNDLIRPSLYQAYQKIEPVFRARQGETSECSYDVVGPVCETGDFLGKDRMLSLDAGDLLAVHSSGAYGFVMSSNYNSRARPPEIMVDGSQVHLVRERENLDDLMRGEHLLP
jgi:diaminopimelate decarboxylase